MKIIHVITAFGIGGAEKLLLNVINKQVKQHEVYLVSFKNKNDLISELNNKVIVKQIPFSIGIIKQLKNYYIEVNPDVIHTHLGHADFIGLWSARNLRAKVFCTMHNIYFKNNFIDLLFFKIYTFLFLNILKNGHIISISKSVENHVLNTLKLPNNRSHLLLNAIPYKEVNRSNKQNETLVLLFVGRLEKQKSISTLLSALKELNSKNLKKQFHLNIVGDGTLRNRLEKKAKDLKIDHLVSFKGEQKNIDDYYSSSDIFILPSIWEGFGIVILEAFRAKTAVIATNIEGPAELIENDVNGLLFEKQNENQLADKILELINNDNKRNSLAQKGHETFSKKYQIDVYVEKLNTLYKNA